MQQLIPILLAMAVQSKGFTIPTTTLTRAFIHDKLALSSTASGTEESATMQDLTRPDYTIEPLAVRIGHGFDIHRMAPIEEAGQPIVIGGVTVTHQDQKVSVPQQSPKHILTFVAKYDFYQHIISGLM